MSATPTTTPHETVSSLSAGPPSVAASIGRSTLFGSLNNVIQVATRLITVPVVISHLGMGGYGIWNIIMITATYMRFGTVGVKTAYQKYVAEATGTGDYEHATKLLSTGCAVMLILSLAALIPAAIFSKYIAQGAGVPIEFLNSAAGSISLLAGIMMMSNVGAAFEAIVMGGHRIDLVRKYTSVLMILEAVAIIVVLRLRFGIFAMAAVMGVSELIYVFACYLASSKIVPQIQLGRQWVTKSVLYELLRFGGSYQLVNYLEVLYGSIVPIAVLRGFGADSAGVYAVVTRVVTSACIFLGAFGPTIVSGGTLVYASGDTARMRNFIKKTFRVIFTITFLPLGFAAVFGPQLAFAWTGSADSRFRVAFVLVCIGTACTAISGIAMVLYRVAGKTLLDNARQVLRIIVLLGIVCFATRLGFAGTLSGLAVAEFVGLVFMMYAMRKTFTMFSMRVVLPDMLRSAIAAALILGVGILALYVPVPASIVGRAVVITNLCFVALACAVVAWPSLLLTGAVTRSEVTSMLGGLLPSRKQSVASAQ